MTSLEVSYEYDRLQNEDHEGPASEDVAQLEAVISNEWSISDSTKQRTRLNNIKAIENNHQALLISI